MTYFPQKSISCCKRKSLPDGVRIPLLLEVGFRCPIPPPDCCDGFNKSILQFHHIEPWAKCREHNPEKMIAVCPTCHYRLDRGEISERAISKLKCDLKGKYKSFDFNEPTLFLRLSREGKLEKLDQELTAVQRYCHKKCIEIPFMPELLIEKSKVLRKLGKAKAAMEILNNVNRYIGKSLAISQQKAFMLARSYIEFNRLNFPLAFKDIENYKKVIPDQYPVCSETSTFQINWRFAICAWYAGKPHTDLEFLDALSTESKYPNDRATYLLARAVIEQKSVSPDWIIEVEELYDSLEKATSLPPLGYEKHTIAELYYLGGKILDARGKKASSRKLMLCSEDYFNKTGTATHSNVYEFHSRKSRN